METKKRERRVASKLCVRCGAILPLGDFYGNKGWATQSFRDAWCKTCVSKFCGSKDSLHEYCWYNNRRWSDDYYDAAVKKARYTQANNDEYLKAGKDKRAEMEARAACRQFFSIMNLDYIYSYTDNIGKEGQYREFRPESNDGTIHADDTPCDNGELLHDKIWNGMYTQRELDYLNDYYARLEEGFVLDNQNIQDYARKAAKASLDADIKYNRMRQGQGGANDWKEAQAIFDNLSKSANFAACRRKPGDRAGMGALGQIIQQIEQTGALQTARVTFPKDDVDRIIEDFAHIASAIGIDAISDKP